MALLTAQKIVQTGLVATYAAASSGGDTLVNTGVQFFHLKNASGVSVTGTVTPVISTVVDPLLGNLTKNSAKITLAAGTEGFLGPFETDAFNSPSGQITLVFPVITGVTIAALYI